MKLTPTLIVQIGSVICATGALLLAQLDLSPDELACIRALVAVIVGLFFMQIGYAQSMREKMLADADKRSRFRNMPGH